MDSTEPMKVEYSRGNKFDVNAIKCEGDDIKVKQENESDYEIKVENIYCIDSNNDFGVKVYMCEGISVKQEPTGSSEDNM